MGSRRRKSKKHYDVNSQPKHITFFFDRSIGRHVVSQELRNKGVEVIAHDDVFHHNTKDEEWLSIAGNNGWLVFTKDKWIKYRKNEFEALSTYSVGMFVLSRGNFKGEEMAQIFINSLSRIKNFIKKNTPPYIVIIDRTGKLYKIFPTD